MSKNSAAAQRRSVTAENTATIFKYPVAARKAPSVLFPIINPMVALIPPGHPLAKEKSVPMEAFAVESYIQTYPGQDVDNARIFSRCHITPNTQFSTMDINATYSMVEAGLGIGINNQVNSSLWQDRVVHLPLKPAQTMNIGLAYGKNISPASEGFLHFIEDKLPE